MYQILLFDCARQSNGELWDILVHDNPNPNTPVTMMAERGTVAACPNRPRFFLINGNR